MKPQSRRQWIRLNSGLLISVGLANSWIPVTPRTRKQIAATGKDQEKDSLGKELVWRTTDPRNGEPELNRLVDHWQTPTNHFYVRSHAPNPKIDPASFRLKIEGMVREPKTLTLDDLSRFQRYETTATMTCAGNRRAEFNEEGKVGGVQWEAGAIGNATWGGYRLVEVLKLCGIEENARHVWFDGLDEIQRKDGTISFGASIPIERLSDDNSSASVLLADQMNGAALTPDHGFPLRTVVPGYIGARSVKWLGKITVSDRPNPNHYVATAYKIVKKTDPVDWAESGPIYRYPINAAICSVAKLENGKYRIAGYALPSGRAGSTIRSVAISKNRGKSWIEASLTDESREYCWSRWSATINIEADIKTLFLRARDTAGDFMPYRVPWNAKGYLQNSWYEYQLN